MSFHTYKTLPEDEERTHVGEGVSSTFGGKTCLKRLSASADMTDDDDDDSLCDASFNGIGYALQVEMLGEVTRAGWRDAEEQKKAAAKRPAPARRRTAK